MSIQAIKEERAGLVAKQRAICDKAIAEKDRPLTTEERAEYDALDHADQFDQRVQWLRALGAQCGEPLSREDAEQMVRDFDRNVRRSGG